MQRSLLSVLLVVSALLGCVAQATFATTDYWPLYMGYCATFREYIKENGYSYSHLSIGSTKEVNGTTCYVLDVYPDGPGGSSMAMKKVEGATKAFDTCEEGGGCEIFGTPQTWIPATVTVGITWQYDEGGGSIVSAEAQSLNETVVTPARVFNNCLKVRMTYSDAPNDYGYLWLAPGVGPVKWEGWHDLNGDDDRLENRSEIVSYTQGASCDTTPPSTPQVWDEGADSYGNALAAKWSSTDAESGIVEYMVSVSTTPDENGILPGFGWHSVGGMTHETTPGLPLTDGETYCGLVKARNGAGLWSEIGVSDGVTVHLGGLNTDPLPLHVGNRWAYRIYEDAGEHYGYIYVENSSVVSSAVRYEGRRGMYESETGQPTVMSYGWATSGGETYLYTYSENGEELTPPEPFIKANPQVGDSWAWEGSGPSIHKVRTVESLSAQVNVTAGLFTCIQMKQTYPQYPDEYDMFWLAPGVGLIKHEYYNSGGLSKSAELTGWHVFSPPQDTSPPPAPVVTDEGDTSVGNILRATWTCSDPESGIL